MKKESLRTKVRSAVSVLLTSIMILTSVIPFSFAEAVSISDGNDISSEAVSDGQDNQDSQTADNEISDETQSEAVGSDENVTEDKNDSADDQTDEITNSDGAAKADDSVSGDKDADDNAGNDSITSDITENQVKDNNQDASDDPSENPSENIDADEDQEQDEEGFIDRLIDNVASLLGLDGVEWEGSGSKSDPYKISTRADMMLLAEKVNGGEGYADKYFVLTNDIDTTVIPAVEDAGTSDTPEKWTPVGTATKTPFKGHFDGAGHKVKIYINTTDSYQGLFGCINGAEIKDLTVSGSITMSATSSSGTYAGGIAAYTDGTVNIENCVNNVDITATEQRAYIGGIIGYTKGVPTLTACRNNGKITVKQNYSYLGGILGRTDVKTVISDCRNNGDVISEAASMSAGGGHFSLRIRL